MIQYKYFKNYKNKKVIVTGHTGFKGAWLTFCLILFGAKVLGISKDYRTNPSLYRILNLKRKVKSKFLDIENFEKLNKVFVKYKPDYVFHLAAQSLVKKSIEEPRNTFLTNAIGTMNIMHALKNLKNKCNAIIITSDKCYLNIEQKKGYKETDRLGGHDPYSASKASAEIIIQCYAKSFLEIKKNIFFVVARAGNVIGGGDWSDYRLVPDCIKAWTKNKPVLIRNPNSTRPWQHVFEAVFGYLFLGISLNDNKKLSGEAFNFGPSTKKNFSTKEILELLSNFWPKKTKVSFLKKNNFNESTLLKLNSNKVKRFIGWKSILNVRESLKLTIEWYKTFYFKRSTIIKASEMQFKKYLEIFFKKIKYKKIK